MCATNRDGSFHTHGPRRSTVACLHADLFSQLWLATMALNSRLPMHFLFKGKKAAAVCACRTRITQLPHRHLSTASPPPPPPPVPPSNRPTSGRFRTRPCDSYFSPLRAATYARHHVDAVVVANGLSEARFSKSSKRITAADHLTCGDRISLSKPLSMIAVHASVSASPSPGAPTAHRRVRDRASVSLALGCILQWIAPAASSTRCAGTANSPAPVRAVSSSRMLVRAPPEVVCVWGRCSHQQLHPRHCGRMQCPTPTA